jgi:phosphohistidine phosphatase
VKSLIIIRHAKAETTFTLNDFERSLNDRGKSDAPVMAKRLHKKIKIDAFVSSPAKRTKKTTEFFAEAYGIEEKNIIYISALYQASASAFFEVVSALADRVDSVAIVAHNPGITDFANQLIPEAKLDNMPTCSVFAVQAEVDQWSDFGKAKREFLFFDYPKNV